MLIPSKALVLIPAAAAASKAAPMDASELLDFLQQRDDQLMKQLTADVGDIRRDFEAEKKLSDMRNEKRMGEIVAAEKAISEEAHKRRQRIKEEAKKRREGIDDEAKKRKEDIRDVKKAAKEQAATLKADFKKTLDATVESLKKDQAKALEDALTDLKKDQAKELENLRNELTEQSIRTDSLLNQRVFDEEKKMEPTDDLRERIRSGQTHPMGASPAMSSDGRVVVPPAKKRGDTPAKATLRAAAAVAKKQGNAPPPAPKAKNPFAAIPKAKAASRSASRSPSKASSESSSDSDQDIGYCA
jgi:hypothetical protein